MLEIIIIILLSFIGIINAVLAEKLIHIEIMLENFVKHYGYVFIPDENSKNNEF